MFVFRQILERNGSAVDAAIAALFCNGLFNMQSMGLGGGFLMTVYVRENKTAYALNARESAPSKASSEFYKDDAMKAQSGKRYYSFVLREIVTHTARVTQGVASSF